MSPVRGKSTLRRDLIERINRENAPVIVIEPYIIAMEDNDNKGKTLKAASIAEAIINTIAPLEGVKRSQEARFRQLHRVLKDSSNAGYSHVLVIEEAHSLPLPTLKHLKRFFELENGFKKTALHCACRPAGTGDEAVRTQSGGPRGGTAL
ncbi:Uncharacterised protein [Klebsiella pneumoniae]|uniref:ORC1/DEAH AAA+ ATPase domain-containing protein n=1 Tax=Klebsiella pneumoniae TaxID=573 RepID=A0A2X3DFK4_KLEPN|nr:Uncharacterised protein [Klebsiella pneumoniae]